jgi:hypothetical protein
VERCNALIDDTLAKGATLVCGGKAQNTLMPATVLDHVTPAMEIYREESFGPVKAAVRVNGVEEAVAIANDNGVRPVFGGVRPRQGLGLRPLRQARGRGGLHGAALDHGADHAAPVPVLSAEPRRCPALRPTSQLVARSPA